MYWNVNIYGGSTPRFSIVGGPDPRDPPPPSATPLPPGHIKWPDLKFCFSKFDIVPKAHQWSELFETRSVQ